MFGLGGKHVAVVFASADFDDGHLVTFLVHCANDGIPMLAHPWDTMTDGRMKSSLVEDHSDLSETAKARTPGGNALRWFDLPPAAASRAAWLAALKDIGVARAWDTPDEEDVCVTRLIPTDG